MEIQSVGKIELELKDGTLVELDMTQKFVDSVRKTFDLSPLQEITEQHVKYFLAGAIKNAVEQTGAGDVEIPA
jgi:hypothetical protein